MKCLFLRNRFDRIIENFSALRPCENLHSFFVEIVFISRQIIIINKQK